MIQDGLDRCEENRRSHRGDLHIVVVLSDPVFNYNINERWWQWQWQWQWQYQYQ